jgi:Cu-Zn family superoxide dismutase
MIKNLMIGAVVLSFSGQVFAADLTVDMFEATTEGMGAKAGTVTISDSDAGARFIVALSGMAPNSTHGFHVHTKPSCDAADKGGKLVPALAAGGHWDPEDTGRHEGAEGTGHLGDLPRFTAGQNGGVANTVVAPRIKDIERLKGHALMVHAKGDNYADMPKKLGGGGARMFCGIIN